MRTIPLATVPNQSLSVRLDNSRLVLRLKEASGVMVADLERDGVVIISGTRVLAGEPIIPYAYLQQGNFILLTVNDELPDWRLFGASQTLLYLEVADIVPAVVEVLGAKEGVYVLTFTDTDDVEYVTVFTDTDSMDYVATGVF